MATPAAPRRLAPEEILDLGDYERARGARRASAMAARARRRVLLGANASLSFENRETLLYQVQEMLRAERTVDAAGIAHELAVYGALLPAPDSLSATLMLEYPEAAEREVRLRALVGIERHLRLELQGAGAVAASFDAAQMGEALVSAVHYVRFRLSEAQRAALGRAAAADAVIDHPAMSARARLTPELAAALLADLEQEHSSLG
jgi:hypothetical protein